MAPAAAPKDAPAAAYYVPFLIRKNTAKSPNHIL